MSSAVNRMRIDAICSPVDEDHLSNQRHSDGMAACWDGNKRDWHSTPAFGPPRPEYQAEYKTRDGQSVIATSNGAVRVKKARLNDSPISDSYSEQTWSDPAEAPHTLPKRKKRSRRLSNSERGKLYRQRRKDYEGTLEQQVEELRHEVEELTVYGRIQHDSLTRSGTTAGAGLLRTVCEYFNLFESGVPVATGSSSPASADAIFRWSRQAGFLNAMMTPDMSFVRDDHGVQMLLEQWERYTMFHSFLKLQVKDVRIINSAPTPVVSADAVLRVRFNRLTVEKIFPHVLWNEDMVQRLIGLEVTYPVGNIFCFNEEGRIQRYDTEVDFVHALFNALGNFNLVSALVGNAEIHEQSFIGSLDPEETGGSPRTASPGEDMNEQRVVELTDTEASTPERSVN